MNIPKKVKSWEAPLVLWLKRHEVPQETIDKLIPFLFKEITKVELAAMRSMVGRA